MPSPQIFTPKEATVFSIKEGGMRSHKLTFSLMFATLVFMTSVASVAKADEVTKWNEIATINGFASGKAGPAQARIYAIAQAAVHDALNAIDRRYQPYAFDSQADPNASPDAAVATAAHDVLVHELPTQQAVFDAAYIASPAAIADGTAKVNGIAIGQAAATALIALRSADGSSAPMPYTPGTGPGVWQPTPPAFLPAALPGWGQVTPFALSSGAQFRPARPAFFDLTSAEYIADYN